MTDENGVNWIPFNIWQMRNCASCRVIGICPQRERALVAYSLNQMECAKSNCGCMVRS